MKLNLKLTIITSMILGLSQSVIANEIVPSNIVQNLVKQEQVSVHTNAKPAPHIKMVIDGVQQQMTDPMVMENNRVFLPIRNVGNLLGVNVDYLEKEKIAVAYNEKAYLELPLGYNSAVKDQTILLPVDANNKDTRIITYNNRTYFAVAYNEKAYLELPLGYNSAVKDQTILLPVDANNKDTRIITYNNRTYLPVRFVAENLGFNITYANSTVTVTTNPTDTPDVPDLGGDLDISKMNPADPTNPHNLQAFKDGRSLSVMPLASWDKIQKPAGANQQLWNNCKDVYKNGVVQAKGKLSDLPDGLNRIRNGKEDFNIKGMTVPRIGVNNKGVLKSSRGGAPTVIFFKDGSSVQVDMGADASIGKDFNGNYFPGKGLKDVSCIVIADTQAYGAYVFYPTGE